MARQVMVSSIFLKQGIDFIFSWQMSHRVVFWTKCIKNQNSLFNQGRKLDDFCRSEFAWPGCTSPPKEIYRLLPSRVSCYSLCNEVRVWVRVRV